MLRIPIVLLALVLLAPAAAAAQIQPTIVAGTGEEVTDDASRGDNGPATAARFHRVDGLDRSTSGSILVADGDDSRIRRITPAGTSSRIAPKGSSSRAPSSAPDGRRATRSSGTRSSPPTRATTPSRSTCCSPATHGVRRRSWTSTRATSRRRSMAIGSPRAKDGVASQVRRLPTSRWVTSPALEGLEAPTGVGGLPGGGFLVATDGDCRIRRRSGGVTTVMAGTGFCGGRENGGNGDGGPATASHLGHPSDVEATQDGGFVMIQRDRLRRVAPDGKISTIYVTGPSSSPDFPRPSPPRSRCFPTATS